MKASGPFCVNQYEHDDVDAKRGTPPYDHVCFQRVDPFRRSDPHRRFERAEGVQPRSQSIESCGGALLSTTTFHCTLQSGVLHLQMAMGDCIVRIGNTNFKQEVTATGIARPIVGVIIPDQLTIQPPLIVKRRGSPTNLRSPFTVLMCIDLDRARYRYCERHHKIRVMYRHNAEVFLNASEWAKHSTVRYPSVMHAKQLDSTRRIGKHGCATVTGL
jgi:hypothetical protein